MPERPPLTDLPVEASVAELREALASNTSAVLQAAPGAGKTTIVPLRLLDEPWLDGSRIVVLEPRRLAVRAAARRMAALLGEDVGETVGYRTRDERHVGRRTRIEVVTEGILTRRLQRDPSLAGVGLVVFDEVHERNLHTDLALALTLDARSVLREDLRVLAMSATLDTARFADALSTGSGTAPVLSCPGRSHEVELRWRPSTGHRRPAEDVAAVVRDSLRAEHGDVLVFLAGAGEIRRVASLLGRSVADTVDVRPLFGALSPSEQDAALAPSPPGRRRVVLATDIAETSLTVEGVRVVVDSGQVRRPRFDTRSGLTRLHTGACSRASADQRAGRAGRTEPGVAYRLWSEAEHASRPAFSAPEITVVDLAGFALELAVWGTDDRDLVFVDRPPQRALDDARSLLVELGAVDAEHRVTATGRAMAELPVHPRLAHMIEGAKRSGSGSVACAIAALLEERDVLRGHPDEKTTDIAERVRLIEQRSTSDPRADPAALATVRHRARELRRRAAIDDRGGAKPGTKNQGADGPDGGGELGEPTARGALLALAYPDRIAQATGGGRFRLRHGTGAWLPVGDGFAGEPFLVIAELGEAAPWARGVPRQNAADHRIRLAAAIDEADIERVAGNAIEQVSTIAWDAARGEVRRRSERRLGSLVLAAADEPAPPGESTSDVWLAQVRATKLGMLRWTGAARALQARATFAHVHLGPPWPDLSDRALLGSLDEWLGPHLANVTRRADLDKIDVVGLLRQQVGYHRLGELDRLVPAKLTIASGRDVHVDYAGEHPSVAVRVQELYGTTAHPTIADGRVPVVVELLSPAGRPIQITADLPGFWAGSWSEVRKEMAGRYPKHPWPQDPASAPARRGTPRRRR